MARKPSKKIIASKNRTIQIKLSRLFEESYSRYFKIRPEISDKIKTFNDHKCCIPPKRLPRAMRDHALSGSLQGFRECHLAGDILLIYTHQDDILQFIIVCNHDDLLTLKPRIKGYC